jgi:hypothetical protein
MGYFDALTSSYFKDGADGQKLFFPWGAMGRGYALPSVEAYERLRGKLKVYTIVSLVAIIAASALRLYLISFAIATVLMAFYVLWARTILRNLTPVAETLSLRESYTSQALAHSPRMLWALQIVSVVFVAIGCAMLIAEPRNWLTALGVIVFFTACAIANGFMIAQRRRKLAG